MTAIPSCGRLQCLQMMAHRLPFIERASPCNKSIEVLYKARVVQGSLQMHRMFGKVATSVLNLIWYQQQSHAVYRPGMKTMPMQGVHCWVSQDCRRCLNCKQNCQWNTEVHIRYKDMWNKNSCGYTVIVRKQINF